MPAYRSFFPVDACWGFGPVPCGVLGFGGHVADERFLRVYVSRKLRVRRGGDEWGGIKGRTTSSYTSGHKHRGIKPFSSKSSVLNIAGTAWWLRERHAVVKRIWVSVRGRVVMAFAL